MNFKSITKNEYLADAPECLSKNRVTVGFVPKRDAEVRSWHFYI